MANQKYRLAGRKREKLLPGNQPSAPKSASAFHRCPAEQPQFESFDSADKPEQSISQHNSSQNSERKQKWFRSFIENAPVAIAMFDGDMRYLAASRCWLRDYGLEGKNILGLSHYEVFPEIPARWKTLHQRALAGEVLSAAEDCFERADGTQQWIRWELQPWFNGRQEVGGVIIFTEDITENRRARETLLEREEKFRRIFSTVSDAILVFDAETREFVEVNDAALKLYGYTRDELMHLSAMDLSAEPDASAVSIAQTKMGLVTRVPLRFHKKKDGTIFPAEIFANTFVFEGRTFYCGVVRDITSRRQTEHLLQKANRTLRAIRDCHEAILRASTEPELLDEICRIIVQSGERMTWVGYAENDARKTVRVMAAAGVSDEHLKNARVVWANVPRGRGPVGTAIRTGRPSLCRNTQTDPNYGCWRDSAKKFGFGSVIGLPLVMDKKCFGALSIYAPEPDAFDESEQQMLTDLVNDLAFGISTLRLRAESKRLEKEIFNSIEREQERIGRDLHDGLCQLLVGAKYRSVHLQNVLRGKAQGRRPAGISAAKGRLALKEAHSLEETLSCAIQQARDLARGLNPFKITAGELDGALQKLAEDVQSTHRIHCFCRRPQPVKISDHHTAYHLFRIAQEAVQNAVKHAKAANISITLTRDGQRVVLNIKDDGVGIVERNRKKGMGLNNMEARARIIGGTFEIHRRKLGGTSVRCELPLHLNEEHGQIRQK